MIVPCIVCGGVLREVFPDVSSNQPNDGVVAVIHGNYGSTVFDPFDGTHLEVVICDACLVAAGALGRVLSGRRTRPARLQDMVVGYEEVDMPLVEWRQGLAGYGDFLELDDDEDIAALPAQVHIDPEAWRNAQTLLRSDIEKAWDN